MNPVEHKISGEARDFALEALRKVVAENDNWMAVVWCVKDGNLERKTVTTWQFPDGDYEIAARQLKAYGDEVIASKAPLPDDPLPTASFVKGIGEAVKEVLDADRVDFEKAMGIPASEFRGDMPEKELEVPAELRAVKETVEVEPEIGQDRFKDEDAFVDPFRELKSPFDGEDTLDE